MANLDVSIIGAESYFAQSYLDPRGATFKMSGDSFNSPPLDPTESCQFGQIEGISLPGDLVELLRRQVAWFV